MADNILTTACEQGNVKNVKNLLVKSKINQRNKNGETPLTIASRKGLIDIVDLLIKNNADVNITNKKGESPLILACRRKYTRCVDSLLKNGANVDYECGETDSAETPLLICCINGDITCMHLLITNGADINKLTNETPLTISCKYGQYDPIRMLLGTQGIEISKPNIEGKTPLMILCEKGYYNCLELLMKHDAHKYENCEMIFKIFINNEVVRCLNLFLTTIKNKE